ncbi:MAG: hypothetical protein JOY94_18560 [Methylobacteriaceae bacterium]|nr:hypothetical protein [Methylobacteriaceae bacterium]
MLALPVTPARAQNDRSWVASNGSDGNPCTRACPCATFKHALSQTNAGGEINCVDQGDFSGGAQLLIDRAITIDCEGVQGRFGYAGTSATAIFVGGATVMLRGLDIDGSGVAAQAIEFNSGGVLHIEKCVFRNFVTAGSGWGIVDDASLSIPSELFVSDTAFENNGTASSGRGILIAPGSANSVTRVTLNQVEGRRRVNRVPRPSGDDKSAGTF